jgi:uncharacterized low-complexity protein
VKDLKLRRMKGEGGGGNTGLGLNRRKEEEMKIGNGQCGMQGYDNWNWAVAGI